MDRDVLSLQTRIHRVEDEIFADFCRLIRVSSIRDYEEQHSRVTEEATAKRLQFTSQISRLENQIAFQRQQRDQILKKVEQLVTQISGGEIDLQALRADRETTLASLASQRAEYKTFASEHQRMRLAIEQKDLTLKEAKKELDTLLSEVAAQQKSLALKETELEKSVDRKIEVLLRCKIEEINIPLLRGSLDSVTEVRYF